MRQSIHIRLPRTLHEQLVATAAEQDVSLNLLVATLLSGAIGFNLVPDDEEPDDAADGPVPACWDDEPPSPAGGTEDAR